MPDERYDSSGAGLMPGCIPIYGVRCDDCKTPMRATGSLTESAAGGICGPCRSRAR